MILKMIVMVMVMTAPGVTSRSTISLLVHTSNMCYIFQWAMYFNKLNNNVKIQATSMSWQSISLMKNLSYSTVYNCASSKSLGTESSCPGGAHNMKHTILLSLWAGILCGDHSSAGSPCPATTISWPSRMAPQMWWLTHSPLTVPNLHVPVQNETWMLWLHYSIISIKSEVSQSFMFTIEKGDSYSLDTPIFFGIWYPYFCRVVTIRNLQQSKKKNHSKQ